MRHPKRRSRWVKLTVASNDKTFVMPYLAKVLTLPSDPTPDVIEFAVDEVTALFNRNLVRGGPNFTPSQAKALKAGFTVTPASEEA